MSYETALLIVVFSFCSYAIGKVEKLSILSIFVAFAPLVYFTSKDISLVHYLVISSLCVFTRHRKLIPFMLTFLTLWAVAKLPLELELLTLYLALTLSRQEVDRNSLDLLMPLSLLTCVVLEQHSLLHSGQLINLFAPLMFISIWHNLFLLGRENGSGSFIDGLKIFRLFIVGYLLPYKMSLILAGATSYIDPQLTNLGMWFILLVSLTYALWVLLRRSALEMTSLLGSLLRVLILLPLWAGEIVEVHYYLLAVIFIELIGQLIVSALKRAQPMSAEVGFRLVILGYAYQFLFLPSSLGALILGQMPMLQLKHTDLVWKLTPYSIAALSLITIISFVTQANQKLRALKIVDAKAPYLR